jgi:ribosome assembly protein 4
MQTPVLVEFEDQEGRRISDRLQIPVQIQRAQLQSLINTTLSLYINGLPVLETLEETLRAQNITSAEEVIKIRTSADEPSTQPALYCSSSYSGHEGPVLCIKYGKVLVTGGGDSTVRFWDTKTRTPFKIARRHDHWVQAVDISADGGHVLSGALDGGLNLYSADGEYVRSYVGHKQAVIAVAFHRGCVLSASRDKTVRMWRMDGEVVLSYAHEMPVTALCSSEDYFVSGSRDGKMKVYRDLKFERELREHTASVNCIDIKGEYMASGCDGGQAVVWRNFCVDKRLRHKGEVISVSISPNGLYLASGSFDKSVRLWSLDTGQELAHYLHVDFVYKVKMMNDLVISASRDKTVKMYRPSKKQLVSDLICDDEVYCFDYSDGNLVCGTRSNRIYFFN